MNADHELHTSLGLSLNPGRSDQRLAGAGASGSGHDEEMVQIHHARRELSAVEADEQSVTQQVTVQLCHKGGGPRRRRDEIRPQARFIGGRPIAMVSGKLDDELCQ
jgi:hypothetical protein